MTSDKSQAPSFWRHITGHMPWHIVLIHFPISFFMVSAGFMVIHMVTLNPCFEVAAFFCLVAGAIMLIPTTWTGWTVWKSKYKGANTKIFRYKINISYSMIVLSLILIGARGYLLNISHTIWHIMFNIGFILLFIGAIAEGFYGGRLNHRK